MEKKGFLEGYKKILFGGVLEIFLGIALLMDKITADYFFEKSLIVFAAYVGGNGLEWIGKGIAKKNGNA